MNFAAVDVVLVFDLDHRRARSVEPHDLFEIEDREERIDHGLSGIEPCGALPGSPATQFGDAKADPVVLQCLVPAVLCIEKDTENALD